MTLRLSHAFVTIDDPDKALTFYRDVLGLEVRLDVPFDGFRWLTVGPPSQPDLEIVLMEPKEGPMLDEEAAQAVRLLLRKGILGGGVFQVDDCRRTYEDLKKKGVQFAGAPEERFYGIEAIMTAGLGNCFSRTQHTDH